MSLRDCVCFSRPGLFTGVHMDRVYFPDIDPLTHTCWLPLGDVPVSHGSMMICEGAHAHGDERFTELRERYLGGHCGRSGTTQGGGNGTDNGWYTADAAEITREFGSDVRWLSADMRAGDCVILPLETLHCTATNMVKILVCIEMFDFVLKCSDLVLKMFDFVLKMLGFAGGSEVAICIKTDEFCIKKMNLYYK